MATVSRSAGYNAQQTLNIKSINLAMDPLFYNSGDPEFKDPLGPLIA